jgi:hypothetical protein
MKKRSLFLFSLFLPCCFALAEQGFGNFASPKGSVRVVSKEHIDYVLRAWDIPRTRSHVRIQTLGDETDESETGYINLAFYSSLPFPDQAYVDSITEEDLNLLLLPPRHTQVVSNRLVELSAAEKSAADAAFIADAATKLSQRQATKSDRLKRAEVRLIKFLREEGAISTGATATTAEQIADMILSWDNLSENQQEKKMSKYNRLLRPVILSGGSETDLFYHPGYE